MDKSVKVILLVLLLGVVVTLGAFFASARLCARQMSGPDDLTWLKNQFGLSTAELGRVRELHQGYLPKCQDMCARIAAKQTELEAALAAGGTDRMDSVEQILFDLGKLRAQCQSQMLRHFEEVSRAMPAGQGERYLVEMQRLTLGYHGQFESSMKAQQIHTGHGSH